MTIYTPELPEIAQTFVNVTFPAKVTIRSTLSIIDKIKSILSKEFQNEFRRWPQLGRLLDLPTTGKFCGTLAHQLLLRRIKCKKYKEIWFLLNGKPLRFSLNEFVLITGLYTKGTPSEKKIAAQKKNNRLINKYWSNRRGVTVDDVYTTLHELQSANTDDRVKLAFVYLLTGFLLARDSKTAIPTWIFSFADDLKFFDKFPWGKICYNHLIEILTGLDMEGKFKDRPGRKDDKSPSQYNILCCPWILQVSFDKLA